MVSDGSTTKSSGEARDEGREQGVDIGSLADKLGDHSYPAPNEEILAAYGDHEVQLVSGSKSLDKILGKLDSEAETYGSADEVRQMIYNMVGADAIGREGYTDRGGIAGERHRREEQAETDGRVESF